MAVINYATREVLCKIVYYGPGMCGKTTNLQKIHAMVGSGNRGELVSLATEQDRTLYFDFLPIDLGSIQGLRTKFQLYTVPGQVYYNATRKLVLRGSDGLVFVADSHPSKMRENIDSLSNLRENLAEYGLNLEEIPWIIQYNKRDLPEALALDEMERKLNPGGIAFTESVADKGQGVKETLKKISSLVVAKLNASQSETLHQQAVHNRDALAGQPDSPPLPDDGATAPYSPHAAQSDTAKTHALSSLSVRQHTAIYWRGLRVGVSRLEARSRFNTDGRGNYQLAEASRFLGIFNRVSVRMIDLVGPERRFPQGQPEEGYRFRVCAETDDGAAHADLWISAKLHDVYFRIAGRFGELRYLPSSHKRA